MAYSAGVVLPDLPAGARALGAPRRGVRLGGAPLPARRAALRRPRRTALRLGRRQGGGMFRTGFLAVV